MSVATITRAGRLCTCVLACALVLTNVSARPFPRQSQDAWRLEPIVVQGKTSTSGGVISLLGPAYALGERFVFVGKVGAEKPALYAWADGVLRQFAKLDEEFTEPDGTKKRIFTLYTPGPGPQSVATRLYIACGRPALRRFSECHLGGPAYPVFRELRVYGFDGASLTRVAGPGDQISIGGVAHTLSEAGLIAGLGNGLLTFRTNSPVSTQGWAWDTGKSIRSLWYKGQALTGSLAGTKVVEVDQKRHRSPGVYGEAFVGLFIVKGAPYPEAVIRCGPDGCEKIAAYGDLAAFPAQSRWESIGRLWTRDASTLAFGSNAGSALFLYSRGVLTRVSLQGLSTEKGSEFELRDVLLLDDQGRCLVSSSEWREAPRERSGLRIAYRWATLSYFNGQSLTRVDLAPLGMALNRLEEQVPRQDNRPVEFTPRDLYLRPYGKGALVFMESASWFVSAHEKYDRGTFPPSPGFYFDPANPQELVPAPVVATVGTQKIGADQVVAWIEPDRVAFVRLSDGYYRLARMSDRSE